MRAKSLSGEGAGVEAFDLNCVPSVGLSLALLLPGHS